MITGATPILGNLHICRTVELENVDSLATKKYQVLSQSIGLTAIAQLFNEHVLTYPIPERDFRGPDLETPNTMAENCGSSFYYSSNLLFFCIHTLAL